MRTLAVTACLAALALAGCGEDDEEPAAQPQLADLTVRVDRDGPGDQAPREGRLRCESPEDSDVCEVAAGLEPEDFAPTPADVACTQQYGGPERATVTGTLSGGEIDAAFSRENGCEIARWDKVAALLAVPG